MILQYQRFSSLNITLCIVCLQDDEEQRMVKDIINSPSVLVVVVEDFEDSARNTSIFLLNKLHRGAQELPEGDQLPESE